AGPRARPGAGPSARPGQGAGQGAGEASPDPAAAAVRKLLKDPSLKGSEIGRQLLRALLATELTPHQWRRIAAVLPEHCAPLVRTVAAQRAAEWNALADAVTPRRERRMIA
ncbi:streptomycin biosynthesis regulator, partial [Streptomyces sp. ISL-66]|nr:streptomycin biosynthesis regulator [Streptomyces sp. ISL-66]